MTLLLFLLVESMQSSIHQDVNLSEQPLLHVQAWVVCVCVCDSKANLFLAGGGVSFSLGFGVGKPSRAPGRAAGPCCRWPGAPLCARTPSASTPPPPPRRRRRLGAGRCAGRGKGAAQRLGTKGGIDLIAPFLEAQHVRTIFFLLLFLVGNFVFRTVIWCRLWGGCCSRCCLRVYKRIRTPILSGNRCRWVFCPGFSYSCLFKQGLLQGSY